MGTAVFLGIVAVWGAKVTLLLWAAAVGGLAAAAMVWAGLAWRGVEVSAYFRPARAFQGEHVRLIVKVSNAKRVPVPMASLAIWLPPGLRPAESAEPVSIRGFRRTLFLPPRSESAMDLPIATTGRGEYWLERLEVELSDPFGLAPVSRQVAPQADLLVMPEPRIAIPIEVLRRLPFGTAARTAMMFEERERFAGVRPYEPGDPLNRIHWKLTGHAGGLQTKLFEPTRSAEVVLALDLSVGEPFWDSVYPEIAEDTIGWTSFLARQSMGAGWRTGLLANTHLTRGRGPLRVPSSAAAGQEAALFGALARMPNEPTSDLASVLREAEPALGKNVTLAVLSPRPGPRLRQQMESLRRKGAHLLHLSPLQAVLEGSA